MRNNKPKRIINFLINIINITIIIIFILCLYSCEKKEPKVEADPDEIMGKIISDLSHSGNDDIKSDCVVYISELKSKELSEKTAKELYSESDNKNEDVIDLSKIEKYSIRQSKKNPAVEVGIFKLYDKVNSDYVKDFMNKRISKKQDIEKENMKNINDGSFLEIVNNAEARSYGNYVYYVSHPRKDRIFKIIENSLREA